MVVPFARSCTLIPELMMWILIMSRLCYCKFFLCVYNVLNKYQGRLVFFKPISKREKKKNTILCYYICILSDSLYILYVCHIWKMKLLVICRTFLYFLFTASVKTAKTTQCFLVTVDFDIFKDKDQCSKGI